VRSSSPQATKTTAVEIPGPVGVLEAEVDASSVNHASAVAVICHPHPKQQGTMHNKVVTTLARAFVRLGATAVRFNFRGVGSSAGSYADGVGERADALAAVSFSRARWPDARLYLGGFSFGAATALAIAAAAAPQGLITVAPPVARLPEPFSPPTCPWVLVHGGADHIVPPGPVLAWCATLPIQPRVVLLEGAGHFFHGHLPALTAAVVDTFGADFEAPSQG
jgi:alpha/beta superfamily hydrolase